MAQRIEETRAPAYQELDGILAVEVTPDQAWAAIRSLRQAMRRLGSGARMRFLAGISAEDDLTGSGETPALLLLGYGLDGPDAGPR